MEKKASILNLTDSNIELTLAQVVEKKTTLQSEIKSFVPKTNMSLEIFGTRYNLHAADLNTLKFLFALLYPMRDPEWILYPMRDSQIENTVGKIEISGFAVSDWVSDILLKIIQIQLREKLTVLDRTERKLREMYSPDMKNQLEFSSLLEGLNKI